MRGFWLVASCLTALSACSVEPVDYTGKSCADGICPDGYVCEPSGRTCVPVGGSLDASRVDAAQRPDAALDAEVEDASEPGADAAALDASRLRDSGGPDASKLGDAGGADVGAADVGARDAGAPDGSVVVACSSDNECRTLGAYYCELLSKTCRACSVSTHCGAQCVACPLSSVQCSPTLGCVQCLGPSDCSVNLPVCSPAGTCVQCLKDPDCGPGRWCEASTSTSTCRVCNDDQHCGGSCQPCGTGLHCDGNSCVGCSIDADCGNLACCNGQCITTEVPKLQRVSPPRASSGAASVALALSGEGFNACAKVLVNGQSVPATVASATLITAIVPSTLLTHAAALPVQVVNPGLGGGPSNPDATSLGTFNLSGTPVDLEYFDPDILAVADGQNRSVNFYDANTGAQLTSPAAIQIAGSFNRHLTSMRGIPTKLWITAENSAALQIVASPLSTPTINTVGLANPGKGVDVDEVANLAVVYTSGAQYHTLDVSTNTLSAPIVFNLATGAGVDGAALDSRHSRILFALSDETFISPLGSNSIDITMTAQSLGATIDRTTGRAWAGGISSLLSFDLSTEAVLPTIPVSQAIHWMRFNPLAHLIVGVPNGMDLPGETSGYGVGLVDPEGGVLLGYLGTGKRGCAYRVGSSVMHEGVAIDQSRNRAFVTCSCDKSLQAYNLNILFVQ